tara:strand:- start:548 stop:949 length:402 start_codon:yes stop_codon:yes gene_type:complete
VNWIVAKNTLRKAWTWLKAYWYVPALLVYTFVMMIVFRRDGVSASKVLEVRKESFKKQTDVIQKAHEKEVEKKKEVIKKYNKVIEKIESEHITRSVKLDAHKKKRIKKLIEDHHENPERMTELLKLSFGIHNE